ncbi:unnamed protein product [Amoebophrya sp. A25]|nr:unnamed protein product [Amoebophrya sp. A25]|eukprot:GSA25T00011842001.1
MMKLMGLPLVFLIALANFILGATFFNFIVLAQLWEGLQVFALENEKGQKRGNLRGTNSLLGQNQTSFNLADVDVETKDASFLEVTAENSDSTDGFSFRIDKRQCLNDKRFVDYKGWLRDISSYLLPSRCGGKLLNKHNEKGIWHAEGGSSSMWYACAVCQAHKIVDYELTSPYKGMDLQGTSKNTKDIIFFHAYYDCKCRSNGELRELLQEVPSSLYAIKGFN